MNDNEELYYPTDRGEFVKRTFCNTYQELMNEYNSISEEKVDKDGPIHAVEDIIIYATTATFPNEFTQAMVLLLLALEKKSNSRVVWLYSAEVAFNCGDLEICRELVLFAIEKSGKSDVNNSNGEFIKLSRENKEENTADILGMIIEELEKEDHLLEENYDELLNDFAGPLEQWRELDIPKSRQNRSYDLIYKIVKLCYKHKAYRTAMRLSGLLYISDQTKNKENLFKTIFLVGKIVYERGYLEVARRCFLYADGETKGECWTSDDEEYHALLQQETQIELTDEILEQDRELKEKLSNKEIKLYTEEEVDQYYDGELESPFINPKKQKKARTKIGEKAIKKYEKYAQDPMEERMKGIEEAFSVFTEKPEVYEAAAYLYYLKANLFLSQNDFETAYEYFQKAYQCEGAKRNGLVLLGTAITLSHMGRMKEAAAYLFRTYILCGKDFITEKVGKKPWEMVEKYL